MKNFVKCIVLAILLGVKITEGIAQFSSNFKPGKEEIFVKSPTAEWQSYLTIKYKYNSNGDPTVRTYYENDGGITKDSIVYNTSHQATELYKSVRNPESKKFIYKDKIVNCYNDGKFCGTLIYAWDMGWHLTAGSEVITSFDQSKNQEEVLTKTFSSESNQWKNVVKEVLQFDNENKLLVKTLYSANPISSELELFSRYTYKGWHNYEKSLYKELLNEKYESAMWVEESVSRIDKVGDLWVNEERRTADNTTYRILFAEDNSYREVMKAHEAGWLLLSIYQKYGNVEKLTENGFDGDILKKIYKREIETNEDGKLIRYMTEETTPAGEIKHFSDVRHELTYNSQKFLIEDLVKAKTSDVGDYLDVKKTLYSEYSDVSVILGLDSESTDSDLVIFPNPGKGTFKLEIPGPVHYEGRIYDSSGNLVFASIIKEKQIDLSSLRPGVYFLRLISDKKAWSKKILIER